MIQFHAGFALNASLALQEIKVSFRLPAVIHPTARNLPTPPSGEDPENLDAAAISLRYRYP